MGSDKAALLHEGRALWEVQLGKLRALGPGELFISGRGDGPYAAAGVAIVEDRVPGLGPLAGIAATLARMEAPRLVVLAVDLPEMSAAYLVKLLAAGSSVIPCGGEFFEPLAAVYSRAALPVAEERLASGERSMQGFVRRLIQAGLAAAVPIAAEEAPLFRNRNRPGD